MFDILTQLSAVFNPVESYPPNFFPLLVYFSLQYYDFPCFHSVIIFLPIRPTMVTTEKGGTQAMATTTAPIATPSMTAGCFGMRI